MERVGDIIINDLERIELWRLRKHSKVIITLDS